MSTKENSLSNPREGNEIVINAVDADFEMLESMPVSERMILARELFNDVLDPPATRPEFGRDVKRVEEKGLGGIKHFFLPHIPGGGDDLETMREGYDERTDYWKSGSRIFVKISQGDAWIIPKSEKPYYRVSTSECSTIVATDSENHYVAHISYSMLVQIRAFLDFLQTRGITPENIHVVASVGEIQKNNETEYERRATEKVAYVEMGIPEDNIVAFEYKKSNDPEGNVVSENITQVIGCNDAMFKYSFDSTVLKRPAWGIVSDKRISDYKDEITIQL